jgi:hypothetical protein
LSTSLENILDYPYGYPNTYAHSDEGPVCAVLPAITDQDILGWAPGHTLDEALDSIDNMVTSLPLATSGSGYQTSAISSILVKEREDYLKALNVLKEEWLANGKVVTSEIFHKASDARIKLRLSFREKSLIPGKVYAVVDFMNGKNRTSLVQNAGRYGKEIQELLDAGKFEEALQRSINKSNAAVKVFIRRLGRLKHASKLGHIALAIQVPYYAGQAYSASKNNNKEELHNALASIGASTITAITGATGMALCLGLGIATAGLSLLACGLVPTIVAGFYADDAARAIINKMDPL